MPRLGFMFSYIQPDTINLKSNHWFQVDSRHVNWFIFHVGGATLEKASNRIGLANMGVKVFSVGES